VTSRLGKGKSLTFFTVCSSYCRATLLGARIAASLVVPPWLLFIPSKYTEPRNRFQGIDSASLCRLLSYRPTRLRIDLALPCPYLHGLTLTLTSTPPFPVGEFPGKHDEVANGGPGQSKYLTMTLFTNTPQQVCECTVHNKRLRMVQRSAIIKEA
jgi:hypothetical protein